MPNMNGNEWVTRASYISQLFTVVSSEENHELLINILYLLAIPINLDVSIMGDTGKWPSFYGFNFNFLDVKGQVASGLFFKCLIFT